MTMTLMMMMIIIIGTGDLYPENEKEEGKEEPEWIKTEREHFSDYRDRNKDGKMDRVREWIVQPPLPTYSTESELIVGHSYQMCEKK